MAMSSVELEKRMAVLALILGISYALFFGTSYLKTGPLIQIGSTSPIAQSGPKVLGEESSTALCSWQPQKSYGSCQAFLGYYHNGTDCVPITGCSLAGEIPPFFAEGSCQQMCE